MSPSRLELSDVENTRKGNGGRGTANVTYRPLAGPRQDRACRGRVRFEFNDGRGTRVDAGTIVIERVRVIGAPK